MLFLRNNKITPDVWRTMQAEISKSDTAWMKETTVENYTGKVPGFCARLCSKDHGYRQWAKDVHENYMSHCVKPLIQHVNAHFLLSTETTIELEFDAQTLAYHLKCDQERWDERERVRKRHDRKWDQHIGGHIAA